eukprot:4326457-Amphidinium_carterae.1
MDQSNARECSATRVRGPETIFVYTGSAISDIGYHTARECTAVTSARSNPRHYTRIYAEFVDKLDATQ